MQNVLILCIHRVYTLVKLLRPGGLRSVVAETLLVKRQLLVMTRSRRRAPNLNPADRLFMGICAGLMRPTRLVRSVIIVKPATLLRFHQTLQKRKYRPLFSPKRHGKPGPKGPSQELTAAILEMKRRNPYWGCPRIAQQISLAFDGEIDKDVIRRVLVKHYRPNPDSGGPSWLSFLGHTKDSSWSIDLFRCESATLRTHLILVVMDQFTRRIIGFGVHAGVPDGIALCRIFNRAIRQRRTPKYLSADDDPLYEFHRWKANLRILEVTEIKTVPYVPLSHPFVERLIGTIHRELLDHILFWSARDLEHKLTAFQTYYNEHRVHSSLAGEPPAAAAGEFRAETLSFSSYSWRPHCRGLYSTPVAA